MSVIRNSEQNSTSDIVGNSLSHREWWNLTQICARKGLSYKSACNRKYLQPNRGIPDGYLNGRKVWHWSTVEEWLLELDPVEGVGHE